MQICTLHHCRDVTPSCPDSTAVILPFRVCRDLEEAFKRVLAGAIALLWAALLAFGSSESLQCPLLLQEEKEWSQFALEQSWWTWECRVGPELLLMQETVMDKSC